MKKDFDQENTSLEKLEESLLDDYLDEMDALVKKYPEDPNQTDLNEECLNRLIGELDDNWQSFRRKWEKKFSVLYSEGTVKVGKDKEGMRHLIIKSDANGKDVIDLTVPEIPPQD